MHGQAFAASLASNEWLRRVRDAVAMTSVALALSWHTVSAEPISLPPDKQNGFRQAFFQAYSNQMAAGGYYDAIKEGDNRSPELRIVDCLGDRCLIDMVLDPGFNSAPYLVKLDRKGIFDGMAPVDIYGRAVESAAFIKNGSAMQVYITSVTHMGTQAAQLFAYDGSKIGDQLALRTTAGNKVEGAEGDLTALDKAAEYAETLSKPFVF